MAGGPGRPAKFTVAVAGICDDLQLRLQLHQRGETLATPIDVARRQQMYLRQAECIAAVHNVSEETGGNSACRVLFDAMKLSSFQLEPEFINDF